MKEFIEYLEEKRIDPITFKLGELTLFTDWEKEFLQLHPVSFTSQKLYLINNIRRRFTLPEDRVKVPVKKSKVAAKPSIAGVKKGISKPNVVGVKRSAINPKITVNKKEEEGTNNGEKKVLESKISSPKKTALQPKIGEVKKKIPQHLMKPKLPSTKQEE